MIRKLTACLVTVLLLLGSITPLNALDKSIQVLNVEQQIINAGPSFQVDYQGVTARVFYGDNGIEIIGENLHQHLDTNFPVKKLTPVKDVDGDGTVDFWVWEQASEYADQLFVISGASGSVISTHRLIRDGYDNALGNVKKNATVRQLIDFGEKRGLVIYDYTAQLIDLSNGQPVFSYTASDNIWNAEIIDDVDADGTNDFALTVQNGQALIISGSTGHLIKQYQLGNDITVTLPYDESITLNATMSLWDVAWYDGLLYVTSEEGHLFVLDPHVDGLEEFDLGVISPQTIASIAGNTQVNYDMTGIKYLPTGLNQSQFFGYRIVEKKDNYLLIDCYLSDPDALASGGYSDYPASVIIFNCESNSVTGQIDLSGQSASFMQACFGQYEQQNCVAVLAGSDTGTQNWALYDFTGDLLLQKNVTVGQATDNQQVKASWVDDKYLIEIYNNGCFTLSPDLKQTAYLFNSTVAQLVKTDTNGTLVKYVNNGQTGRLALLAQDLQTVIWEYQTPDFSNKGLEYINTDYDYNGDGANDVLAIVNRLNKDGDPFASYFLVINGKTGQMLHNAPVVTGKDAKKNKIYLVANKLELVKDVDGDKKKELVADDNIISSKKNTIRGSWSGQPYVDGQMLEIGDANNDGIVDYLVVTNKEARLYTSRLTTSYGYTSVEYKKTSTVISVNKKNEPMDTTVVFGDITNDGVDEVVFIGYNAAGSQIYKVYNGKTLKPLLDLCPDGVTDSGDTFMVLPNDFNGDGYNEIYALMDWGLPCILNGADGTLIKEFGYRKDIVIYDDTNATVKDVIVNPKLDYLVPFTVYEGDTNFVVSGDYNQDGLNDIAFIESETDQETWIMSTYLTICDAKTMTPLTSVLLGKNDYEITNSTMRNVTGSDNYLMLKINEKTKLINTKTGELVATFNKQFDKAFYVNDQDMLVADDQGTLYKLAYQRSFSATVSKDGQTFDSIESGYDVADVKGNKLYLRWQSLQPYSVMTITDNGSTIYQGAEQETEIQLVEGSHVVVLQVDDGQGKSSALTFTVTIPQQNSSASWLLVIVGIGLIGAALYLGLNRKAKVRQKAGIKKNKKNKPNKKNDQKIQKAASEPAPSFPIDSDNKTETEVKK